MRKIALSLLLVLVPLGLMAQSKGSKDLLSEKVPDPRAEVQSIRWVYQRDAQEPLLEVEVQFFIPQGLYQQRDDDFFYIAPANPEGWGAFETAYTPDLEYMEKFDSADGPVDLLFRAQAPNDIDSFELLVNYQICNYEGLCYLPSSLSFALDLPARADQGTGADGTIGSADPSMAGLSLPLALIFALLGGLLLNVMPCVFPLISIKAMNLVNLKKQGAGRPVIASLFYSAGVVGSLLILALIVIVIKQAGGFVGWGFYFQSPWFVFILTLILFGFSLSLMGVYTLAQPNVGQPKGKGYGAEFSSGFFAVIVATPCTAPFLGSALAFAFAQPPLTIALFFVVVGIGFSLPYVLFTLFPPLLKLLPKPGKWMETFERVMGFLLMGTALYLLSTLVVQVDKSQIMGPIVVIFIMSFLLWIWGKVAGPARGWIRNLLATVALVGLTAGSIAVLVDFSEVRGAATLATEDPFWEPFDSTRLAALQAQGQPVFVDVWAQWCTNCKVNEAVVFSRQEVQERISELGVVPMKADFTRPDPEIAAYLESVGRVGLPVYALYVPGNTGPLFFAELLEPAGFLSQLEDWVRGSGSGSR